MYYTRQFTSRYNIYLGLPNNSPGLAQYFTTKCTISQQTSSHENNIKNNTLFTAAFGKSNERIWAYFLYV